MRMALSLFSIILLLSFSGPAYSGLSEVSFDKLATYSSSRVILQRMLLKRHFLQAITIANKNHTSLDSYPIDPSDESWLVYTPENDSNEKPGLLVWIPESSSGVDIDKKWKQTLDNHNLVLISALDSGLDEDLYSRIAPLALNAVNGAISRYDINPKRIFIGATGKAGESALAISLAFPEIFSTTMLLNSDSTIGTTVTPTPNPQLLEINRKNRFFISTDITNLARSLSPFEKLCFNYFTVTKQTQSLASALDFVTSVQPASDAGEDCLNRLNSNIQSTFSDINDLIDAGKLEDAITKWKTAYQDYGGLAENQIDRTAERLLIKIRELDPARSEILMEKFAGFGQRNIIMRERIGKHAQ